MLIEYTKKFGCNLYIIPVILLPFACLPYLNAEDYAIELVFLKEEDPCRALFFHLLGKNEYGMESNDKDGEGRYSLEGEKDGK